MTTKTDYGYVVMTPKPGDIATSGQQLQQQAVMYFKIGTQSNWGGARASYDRCNPNFWFRTFSVNWPTTMNTTQGGDLFGNDGPLQIEKSIFRGQARYTQITNVGNGETEWFSTTDANCIQALRNMQDQWDTTWAPTNLQVENLDPNKQAKDPNNAPLPCGTVKRNTTVQGIQAGPIFSYRNGAVRYFKNNIGIPSDIIAGA